MTDIDARLARVLANIARPGPIDDAEPDYEAAWEARHDPEGDTQRMEDAYEREIERNYP